MDVNDCGCATRVRVARGGGGGLIYETDGDAHRLA